MNYFNSQYNWGPSVKDKGDPSSNNFLEKNLRKESKKGFDPTPRDHTRNEPISATEGVMRSFAAKAAGPLGPFVSLAFAANDDANRWIETPKPQTVSAEALPVGNTMTTQIPRSQTQRFAQAGPLGPQQSQEELMRMQMMQRNKGGYGYG